MGVYRCPICNGTGLVHGNFYGVTMAWEHAMRPERHVPCRACYGRGVIVDDKGMPIRQYSSVWPNFIPTRDKQESKDVDSDANGE